MRRVKIYAFCLHFSKICSNILDPKVVQQHTSGVVENVRQLFVTNFILFSAVKEVLKSVKISQSYHHMGRTLLFTVYRDSTVHLTAGWTTLYYISYIMVLHIKSGYTSLYFSNCNKFSHFDVSYDY